MSTLESNNDARVVGKTSAGGDVVLVGDDDLRLMIYDTRKRCIATIDGDELAKVFDMLDCHVERCARCHVRVHAYDHASGPNDEVLCDDCGERLHFVDAADPQNGVLAFLKSQEPK